MGIKRTEYREDGGRLSGNTASSAVGGGGGLLRCVLLGSVPELRHPEGCRLAPDVTQLALADLSDPTWRISAPFVASLDGRSTRCAPAARSSPTQ